jgi:tetratricopeptide (TPR) repeat protein
MRDDLLKRALASAGICVMALMLCGYVQYRRAESEEMLSMASELSDKGSWAKSVDEYKKYLEKNPEAFATRKDIGTLYAWSNEWKKAQQELEEYLERVPTDLEALEVLGDSYLYDNKYEKALATYKKIFEIEPALVPQFGSRLKEIRLARASYATYSFSYYEESNRNIEYKAITLEHDWEYYQFVQDKMYLVATLGDRFDDTLKKYTPIYGAGFSGEIFENAFLDLNAKFEKDRSVNRLCWLRTVFSMALKDKFVFSAAEDTVWYWDRNFSQSVNINLSRSFLKDDSFLLMGSIYYDQIKKTSPYFVRIDDPYPDSTDKPLKLWTYSLTAEKSFRVNDRINYGIGETVGTNTDAVSIFTTFLRGGFRICDNMNLSLYGSWGYDTQNYMYCYGSVYTSFLF